MSQTSKTLRRLCLATGVVTVAGVLPALAAIPALAAPSGTGLTISPTTLSSASTSKTTFTTAAATNANGGNNTITINSLASSGSPVSFASEVAGNFTVSYVASGSTTSTTDAVSSVTVTSYQAAVTVASAIPAGAAVTVTNAPYTSAGGVSTNEMNPGSASSVYFNVAATGDTGSTNTPSVTIANVTPTTASVTGINPVALPSGTAEPFTLTGTNFSNVVTGGSPVVCFVKTGSTVPTSPSGCTGTGYFEATGVTYQSPTEITGTSPVTSDTANTTYNAVVYNETPTTAGGTNAASPATYTAPSSISAANEITMDPGLDFVPESGIRIANSSTGFNLPNNSIPSGSTEQFALSNISATNQPTSNLPATPGTGYTGLVMNVTAVAPSGVGNLQVYAVGHSVSGSTTTCANTPNIATVNFQPGVDTSNYTVVPVTTGDTTLCVKDNGASVNAVMDLTGYTIGTAVAATSTAVASSSGFVGSSTRLLDTRPASETGGLLGPLAGRTVYSLNTGLAAGTKVALDVTAVAPTAVGNLRVFPEPSTGPSASSVPNTAVVNYVPNVDAGSYYITQVGSNGRIDLYSDSAGMVNVVIDLYGEFGSTSHVTVLSQPYRVFDSRPSGIASGASDKVTVANTGTVSDFTPLGAVASIGSLSDINPSAVGHLRTYPDGTPLTGTATMPNYPMQIRENLVSAALSPSTGAFDLYSYGSFTNSTFDATAYVS